MPEGKKQCQERRGAHARCSTIKTSQARILFLSYLNGGGPEELLSRSDVHIRSWMFCSTRPDRVLVSGQPYRHLVHTFSTRLNYGYGCRSLVGSVIQDRLWGEGGGCQVYLGCVRLTAQTESVSVLYKPAANSCSRKRWSIGWWERQ